ncbi:DUF5672 family protein [Arcticibacter tournemirensis]
MNKVAVIIPIYKNSLSSTESIALQQCFRILGSYPIIFIKPRSLTLPNLSPSSYSVVSFDEDYFKDIQGYNRLMLSSSFYETFLDYKYILIYQLDAFVFKDELEMWCDRHFDYIGAPWLYSIDYPNFAMKVVSELEVYIHRRYNFKQKGTNLPTYKQQENQVGNGGFSLRNVEKLYQITQNNADLINFYNNQESQYFNEDNFLCIEVNRRRKVLNIPSYNVAVKFSIEHAPERGFRLNNNQLPFGCHAWDRALEFWRPHIRAFGYDI